MCIMRITCHPHHEGTVLCVCQSSVFGQRTIIGTKLIVLFHATTYKPLP